MPRFLGYIYYEATTILQPNLGYINCESNRTPLTVNTVNSINELYYLAST